jgi:hypothetical protein
LPDDLDRASIAYAKNILDSQRALLTGARASATSSQIFGGAQNGQTTYRGVTYTDPREFGVTFRAAIGSL